MSAFHAYDIRGIYNIEFNKEDVYKIGNFLPGLLNATKILVGKDVRESSPEVFEYLCKGITDCGVDVYNAGLTTTPMIYWATAKYDFDASVMITASHNSKEYNGLKFSQKNALPVGYDTGLKEIEQQIIDTEPVHISPTMGKIIDLEIKQDYLNFQRQYLTPISELKIAIDCSNGMAGLLIRELLGNSPIYINEELDGSFPNHEPNPLVLKNVKQLQDTVIKEKCDMGIIFDGDADRVMFVDEKGQFISPDLIIAVLGHYFLEEKGLIGNVLQDIRTSKSVPEYIEKFGSQVHIWKVGRAFASLKLREIDGIYGGELAGHYYFRDFFYSDSGILACLLVLRIIKKFKEQGKKVSEIINQISNYANSGEINFRIEEKKSAIEEVKNYFTAKEEVTAFYDFDGYRLEFKDWWFNIRPSNTEPYLRLLVEAKDNDTLDEKVSKIKSIIKKYR
ncbi:MAG: phosphomannomutase/phosphoglucomutase [Bacteroidales bacterium]|nr:phosphomannomutase/phosphoglucomutase [Bacteroidales bacterium]